MKANFLVSAAGAALLGATVSSPAATMVTATTDLNVRAGPGPQHAVIGVIGAGQSVTLDGCIRGSKWCTVNGGEGWVFSDYLVGEFRGARVVITERPADSGIAYVPAPDSGTGGVVGGAVTGAIVGGTLDEAIDPPGAVRTYIADHTMEPVYLDGEVVVGATLPEQVVVREIPDYRYRYVYVNSQPVLVEPQSRRIVYVLR